MNLIRSSDQLRTNGKIDHSKFYGYTTWITTEPDKTKPVTETIQREECTQEEVFNKKTDETEIKEICETINEEITTYPHEINITNEGVNLGQEVALLRQQVYELTNTLCGFTPFKDEQVCIDFAGGQK